MRINDDSSCVTTVADADEQPRLNISNLAL